MPRKQKTFEQREMFEPPKLPEFEAQEEEINTNRRRLWRDFRKVREEIWKRLEGAPPGADPPQQERPRNRPANPKLVAWLRERMRLRDARRAEAQKQFDNLPPGGRSVN
jgi:hypothetical protein